MSSSKVDTIFRAVCPSCGNRLGDLEIPYKRLIEQGMTPADAMDYLKVPKQNICCRTRILSPVILPTGRRIENYQLEGMIETRNVKAPSTIPCKATLIMIENYNGEDFVSSAIPVQNPFSYSQLTNNPNLVLETGSNERSNYIDFKYLLQSENIAEKRIVSEMDESPLPRH